MPLKTRRIHCLIVFPKPWIMNRRRLLLMDSGAPDPTRMLRKRAKDVDPKNR